ncbi:AIR synthase related, N-terminal domain protein, partial [Vibrio parahaemolyticus V-223/04]
NSLGKRTSVSRVVS